MLGDLLLLGFVLFLTGVACCGIAFWLSRLDATRLNSPLLVFVLLLFAVVFALVFRIWLAVLVASTTAIAILPAVRDELSWSLKNTRFEGRVPFPRLSLSRAQQIALGGLLLLIWMTWRIVEGGLGAVVIAGPAFAAYVGWLVLVVRREGWSGEKLRTKAGVD